MRNERRIDYDERQLMERGRAFKRAYLTLLGMMALIAIGDEAMDGLRFDGYSAFSIPFWISVVVLYQHLIRHDAFAGVGDVSHIWLVPAVIGLGGLAVLIITLVKQLTGHSELLADGVISPMIAGYVSGICMALIGLIFLMKRRTLRQAGAAE